MLGKFTAAMSKAARRSIAEHCQSNVEIIGGRRDLLQHCQSRAEVFQSAISAAEVAEDMEGFSTTGHAREIRACASDPYTSQEDPALTRVGVIPQAFEHANCNAALAAEAFFEQASGF